MSDPKKPNSNSQHSIDGSAPHQTNSENGNAQAEETLLEFPCDFPIKIMGLNNADVREAVNQIMKDYERTLKALAHSASDTPTGDALDIVATSESIPVPTISEQPSRTGKYVSFTVTMRFFSKPTLDQIYQRFIKIEGVSMVL